MERTVFTFRSGVWNRVDPRSIPDDGLYFARNATYRLSQNGISKRVGSIASGSAIAGITGITGLGQYANLQTGANRIIAEGITAGLAYNLYKAAAGNLSAAALSFAAFDSAIGVQDTDSLPSTYLAYNDKLYWSIGGSRPRAYNDTTARAMGIAMPASPALPILKSIGSSGISVTKAFHFAYRFYNSTDKVRSDLIHDGSKILYSSWTTASGNVQGWEIQNLPIAAPETGVDKLEVFMTLDETNPSVFYKMATVTIGDGPVYKPTASTATAGTTTNASLAYDASEDTYAIMRQLTGGVADIEHRWHTFSTTETRSDWRVSIIYDFSVGAGAPAGSLLQYSTNGGGAWTTMATLTANAIRQTVTADLAGAISNANIQMRAVCKSYAATGVRNTVELHIRDIKLTPTTAASSQVVIQSIPTGAEDFINTANFGQYQIPPNRIFPFTFEGRALGVSNTNGQWLAYSRTDEPEHWSTDPNLAAFPNLIPFKEREIDKIVGAIGVKNNLIVFCLDSVWRINHLPNVADPEGDLSVLFAEARNTVKERITDTVGCVGPRAYCILQLTSDQDVVLFWSRLGPMITDGFKVWRVADHFDWNPVVTGLLATNGKFTTTGGLKDMQLINDTDNRRIIVLLQGQVAAVLFYDPSRLIQSGEETIGMSVLAPWDIPFPGAGGTTPLQCGIEAYTTTFDRTKFILVGDSALTVPYIIDNSTLGSLVNDANGGAIVYRLISKRIGESGVLSDFNRLVIAGLQTQAARNISFGNISFNPDIPVDFDPLVINARGYDLEFDFIDDTVTFRVRSEDGEDVQAVSSAESISGWADNQRRVLSMTLFHEPTKSLIGD